MDLNEFQMKTALFQLNFRQIGVNNLASAKKSFTNAARDFRTVMVTRFYDEPLYSIPTQEEQKEKTKKVSPFHSFARPTACFGCDAFSFRP